MPCQNVAVQADNSWLNIVMPRHSTHVRSMLLQADLSRSQQAQATCVLCEAYLSDTGVDEANDEEQTNGAQ